MAEDRQTADHDLLLYDSSEVLNRHFRDELERQTHSVQKHRIAFDDVEDGRETPQEDDDISSLTYQNRIASKWEQLLQAIKPIFNSPAQRSLGKTRRRTATIDAGVLSLPVDEDHDYDMPADELEKNTSLRSKSQSSGPSLSSDTGGADSSWHKSMSMLRNDDENAENQFSFARSHGSITMPRLSMQFDMARPAFTKRRSSMHLPRTVFRDRSRAKERIREAIERIRNLKIPSNLLKKRQTTFPAKSTTADLTSSLQVPFMALRRDEHNRKVPPYFLELLHLAVVDTIEYDGGSIFVIELGYGAMKWQIKRSLVELLRFHSVLAFRYFQQKFESLPKFPSQLDYAIGKARALTLPGNDIFSTEFILARLMSRRRKAIENYLIQVLKQCQDTVFYELFSFFELGPHIVVNGWKGKESYVRRVRKRVTSIPIFRPFLKTSKATWLVVRDSYIAAYDTCSSPHPRNVILFDHSLRIKEHKLINPIARHKFKVNTRFQFFSIKTDSERQREEFLQDIKSAFANSVWNRLHENESFAPIRSGVDVKCFTDGQAYFSEIYEAINSAKNTLYIGGWWLSPMMHLLRPAAQHPESRINVLLKKKAEEGVMIYIILYKEMQVALTIDSAHSKQVLQEQHRNIKVVRFPDHLPGGVVYWALHDKIVIVDEQFAYCGGIDLCMGRFDTTDHPLGDGPAGSDQELFRGMDYSNPRIRDFRDVQEPATHLVDRNTTARMGWHDISCRFNGGAARDLARHFVQRWNFIKVMKGKDKLDLPFLLPPTESLDDDPKGTCDVQVIRSVSYWSMGLDTEQSIYNAYVNCISGAEHFIYIENQFFVSSSAEQLIVKNRIAEAICDRIIAAWRQGKKFRVFIVMPLLPGFESEVGDLTGATVRLIIHWLQKTISREGFSIIQKLLQHGIQSPFDYISVCSLRKCDRLSQGTGPVVTEQIYVHSKIMVVDDRVAIIGSANINDRSMLGNRDGEVGVVIRDTDMIPSVVDGREFMVGRVPHDLRMKLFSEHTGMSSAEELELLRDPLDDNFYHNIWNGNAFRNTEIFRNIFRCIPDDLVHTWEDYQRLVEVPFRPQVGHVATADAPAIYEPELAKIKGHLVLYPLNFLCNENLADIFPAREYLLPMDVFI